MPNNLRNYRLSNISDFWISDITERVIDYTHPKTTIVTDLIDPIEQENSNSED